MAEELLILKGSREQQYQSLIPQIRALVKGEPDQIANMANVCAALKSQFEWLWIGFYLVRDEELVLGPFQGPVACTRIGYEKGVCGAAWARATTILVPDVEKFPGHIACSSLSRSEIVIPLFKDGRVIGVLDVDSDELNSFSDLDRTYLEKIVGLLTAG